MKRYSMRGGLLVLPALLLAVTLNADTLVLRDGRRIQGQLISVRNGIVEFGEAQQFGGGRSLRIDRDQILGIEFDRFDRFDRSDRDFSRTPAPGAQAGRRSGLRERQVMVVASVPWSDTGIDVESGQEIYFQASGEVRWGPNRRDNAGGEENSPMNPNRPIANRPAAALIGRVGAGSTDYFFIGTNRGPVRMRSSGRLFLGVNDDYLQDNSGSFRVIVYY